MQARLEFLRTKERQNVAEEIKTARGFGDLSENAEYDAARKRQAEVEGEIAILEAKLRLAKIIKATKVEIVDLTSGKMSGTYTIVGTSEANVAEKLISDESPIGRAIVKANAGEVVSVTLPNGNVKQLKIVSKTN
jgi:transcription elongation factor GreA